MGPFQARDQIFANDTFLKIGFASHAYHIMINGRAILPCEPQEQVGKTRRKWSGKGCMSTVHAPPPFRSPRFLRGKHQYNINREVFCGALCFLPRQLKQQLISLSPTYSPFIDLSRVLKYIEKIIDFMRNLSETRHDLSSKRLFTVVRIPSVRCDRGSTGTVTVIFQPKQHGFDEKDESLGITQV